MWFAGDDANIEDAALRMTTGGVIRVGDVTQIKPTVTPDMTPVGQRAEAILEANMREATGVTRAVQGLQEGGPRQSATQFSQLLAQAGERVQLMLETFATNEWRDLWLMAHSLNQQFLKQSTFLRMTERESAGFPLMGAEGEVSQADLTLQMDFTTDTFQDKAQQKSKAQSMIQIFQEISKLPPTPENRTFFNILFEKIWVEALGYGREELVDDQGNPILLTHLGAQSIFDEETKSNLAAQQQEAQQQAESPAQVEQGGINDANLEILEQAQLGQL
jgi:hypothetical protein